MTDRITLSGLRVRGYHGVLPEERRDGQDFVVDAVLSLDTRARPRVMRSTTRSTTAYSPLTWPRWSPVSRST